MAKGTIFTLFILAIITSVLIGINIGKNINTKSDIDKKLSNNTILSPTLSPSPIPTLIPSRPALGSSSSDISQSNPISTYTDKKCGFTISFPTAYLSQKTNNDQSVIFTDPNDPNKVIALVCANSIPRPPVSSDNIESIKVGGEAATLYHDKDSAGNPRDEMIVKNPSTGLEIIIAGNGELFNQVINSFKFL